MSEQSKLHENFLAAGWAEDVDHPGSYTRPLNPEVVRKTQELYAREQARHPSIIGFMQRYFG